MDEATTIAVKGLESLTDQLFERGNPGWGLTIREHDLAGVVGAHRDLRARLRALCPSTIAAAYRFKSHSAFPLEKCLVDCDATATSQTGRANRGDHEHVPSCRKWSKIHE